jgi:hypothetical protein
MKTQACRFLRILLVGLLAAAAIPSFAQPSNDFFTIDGIVRDSGSRRPLPNVSVSVPGTRVGTVTNADGTFSIKIRHDLGARQLEFSLLGYRLLQLPLDGQDRADITVDLSEGAILLTSVVVVNQQARPIVEEAMRRIGSNYSDRTSLLTGFYRETVQKRSNYVDIAEAVVRIYRTSYAYPPGGDRIHIVKGRRLVSPRVADTLAVKLQGGPNTYLFSDIVRNRELLLDPQTLDFYRFRLEEPILIDDRPHYTVVFEPQVSFPDYALYTGRLYIDRESLTISRAEYACDMSDRGKVTSMILRRKPASLRFNPDEVSYVLNYQQRDGRSYLYYIGTRIRFRCDWRRRFFATNYSIFSELVITDGRDEDIAQIPFRESFRENHSLSDRVGDFYDAGFWEDYNIIEPTESLESAVDRLKRRIE